MAKLNERKSGVPAAPKVEIVAPKVEVLVAPKQDSNVVIVSNSADAVVLARYKDQIGKIIRTIDGRQF